MRLSPPFVLLAAALALAACARQVPRYAARADGDSELDARMYGAPQPRSYVVRRAGAGRCRSPADASTDGPYTLDSGDKLRIVVFGQDALSNNYTVDAQGAVTLPLVGAIEARGLTTAQLGGAIAGRLKSGYVRDPSVAVEIETYRPFFVLGEVTLPGPVSLRAEHDGGERHRHRRRLHAARLARQGHHHPQGAGRAGAHRAAAALSDPPRRHGRNLRTLVLTMPDLKPLRIVHVTRTPVGGIFRHILDVACGQAARGHASASSATARPAAHAPTQRLPAHRAADEARRRAVRHAARARPADLMGFVQVSRHLAALKPDVLHGHGAKGGAFVRLMPARAARSGSTRRMAARCITAGTRCAAWSTARSSVLSRRTELFLFESAFARDAYQAMVGAPRGIVRVVPNGISAGRDGAGRAACRCRRLSSASASFAASRAPTC